MGLTLKGAREVCTAAGALQIQPDLTPLRGCGYEIQATEDGKLTLEELHVLQYDVTWDSVTPLHMLLGTCYTSTCFPGPLLHCYTCYLDSVAHFTRFWSIIPVPCVYRLLISCAVESACLPSFGCAGTCSIIVCTACIPAAAEQLDK